MNTVLVALDEYIGLDQLGFVLGKCRYPNFRINLSKTVPVKKSSISYNTPQICMNKCWWSKSGKRNHFQSCHTFISLQYENIRKSDILLPNIQEFDHVSQYWLSLNSITPFSRENYIHTNLKSILVRWFILTVKKWGCRSTLKTVIQNGPK